MHQFGVWAPKAQKMTLKLGAGGDSASELPMTGPDSRGWWRVMVPEAECGADYAFLFDDDPTPYPDPRSLHQPNGVHGMSRLVDHSKFPWTDQGWHSPRLSGGILYELHIGTFSQEGTYDGAIQHLDHLADLGVTHIEIMPVSEFAGSRGWGYDGVALFAVFEPYGGPDGLKRLVDACHAKGLGVIMDVVYNHFGPVGNYTTKFGPYLTDKYHTPWGAAVNFNEAGSDEVRRFFLDNATMWLKDYHCDGLRLDAVHEYIDRSAVNFMEQLSADVERLGDTLGRNFFLIAESDLNNPLFVRPREARGFGMDAQWSDDFHHALFTLIYNKEPGRGYYDDFGSMEHLEKALKQNFVYDGNFSGYRGHSHGRPIDNLSAHHFINYSQNHDQIGNRAQGERLEHLTDLDTAKVALGLTLLAPYVPMIFMGEEWAASAPFLYFADHEEEEMRRMVSEGRKKDFAHFGFDQFEIPDPEAVETFEKSKLDWTEVHQGKHEEMYQWTKELIRLRRSCDDFNDGDLGHLRVQTDNKHKTLIMQRGEHRVLVNLGGQEASFEILNGETLKASSRKLALPGTEFLKLPPMTLAVLAAEELC